MDLGNAIAQCVISTFNNLNVKSGKPTTRSNGVKEWTVLAGVVVVSEQNDVSPVCISTGVKCLPDAVRNYSKGLLVHDLHAEVLSLRLLNWYIIEEFEKLREDPKYTSIAFVRDGSKLKVKSGIKFALFISEPPCGDASMSLIASETAEEWDRKDAKRRKVVRGRENFHEVGFVRTKPGRADSLITYSKSCSDKLCIKQLTGLNNCITAELTKDPIYLSYLVVDGAKYNSDDFKRCFQSRFTDKIQETHPLQFLTYNNGSEYGYHKPTEGTSVPSQLSLLHIVPTNFTQVLNNGVKNGAFRKNQPPKKGGESILCKQSFFTKYSNLKLSYKGSTYERFKRGNESRTALKDKGKEILDNWVPSSDDDFDIPCI